VNQEKILAELVALLEAHGVTVRTETLGESAGGLCVVHQKQMLFLDRSASTAARIALCAQAALRVIDLETVYVKPGIRELLRRLAHTDETSGAPHADG